MIRVQNANQENMQIYADAAGTPPATITTTGNHYKALCRKGGRLIAAVVKVIVAPTAGGTNHVQKLSIQNGGQDATGSTLITAELFFKNTTPQVTAGQVIVLTGVAGHHLNQGDVLKVACTESGTPGGTDAAYSLLQLLFQSDDHLDATDN